MTRKAARGRKTAARTRTRTAASQGRAATRTGRKTSSARVSETAAGASRNGRNTSAKRTRQETERLTQATPGARPAATAEAHAVQEPLPVAQHDEDEDTDWLGEDEDPRSQIVEDDDDWEPQGDDEW